MALFTEPYVTNGTGFFWDIDECEIPEELTGSEVVPRIRQKLLDLGLRGPASIRLYGDLTGLDLHQTTSSSEDVKLNHFQAGEKREKVTKILEDIVAWSGENPEPSVGILVLGELGEGDDADLAEVIQLLETRKNYRFVVVSPDSPPPPPPPTVVMILPAIPRGGL